MPDRHGLTVCPSDSLSIAFFDYFWEKRYFFAHSIDELEIKITLVINKLIFYELYMYAYCG